MLDGGHLVARTLKREQIDTVFTLCGGHIMPICNGLIDEGIRIVDLRHAQAAAYAPALVFSRYDEVVRALGGYGEFVDEARAIRVWQAGVRERAYRRGSERGGKRQLDGGVKASALKMGGYTL